MISVYGYAYGFSGMCHHAIALATALRKFEEVALVSWNGPQTGEEVSPPVEEMVGNAAARSADSPCLGIGSIESMATMSGGKRCAYVVWEPSRLPRDKVKSLKNFDEIWTPSTWGRQLVIDNQIPAENVFVIPEGVDPETFRPREQASDAGRPFRFLCAGKWEPRKNIGQLVEAFCREFRPDEPVELVLHCHNAFDPDAAPTRKRIQKIAGQVHAPIRVNGPLSGSLMPDLYRSCDCFVLPTRAEGWGLPIMEAMSCGLPAIVTNYSAPTDYLNEQNGYPVKVAEMVDVYDPFYYPSSWDLGQWAQPDGADLRRILRHVFQHPEEAREKGRQARADILERWTWDHAAAIAYRRLRPELF
jgi:glycosyltransferase involved in cell wall biosynthesis